MVAMNITLELIVTLLWIAFFLAAFFGVKHEYDQFRLQKDGGNKQEALEDDDPVYILEP